LSSCYKEQRPSAYRVEFLFQGAAFFCLVVEFLLQRAEFVCVEMSSCSEAQRSTIVVEFLFQIAEFCLVAE
jgi:hypothetical protein